MILNKVMCAGAGDAADATVRDVRLGTRKCGREQHGRSGADAVCGHAADQLRVARRVEAIVPRSEPDNGDGWLPPR
eukprot:1178087-Prorocentrum_minimum.AAC.1